VEHGVLNRDSAKAPTLPLPIFVLAADWPRRINTAWLSLQRGLHRSDSLAEIQYREFISASDTG
jgi:hypothetical protein